ncbi:MAG: prepilin peptidase [Chloroflexota bacterium]|nr:prepilin peptidase [Chloroflexota bacterium]
MLFDLVAPAIASVAAACDIFWRRIPNWLTFSAFLAGLSVHAVMGGASGLLVALGGAALGLCLLLPFYVIHAMGAGDVKLLTALGALLGPHALVSVAIYTALAGGAIALVLLARQGRLQLSLGDVMTRPLSLRRGGAKAPYGVAIACGVYLAMLLPSVIG